MLRHWLCVCVYVLPHNIVFNYRFAPEGGAPKVRSLREPAPKNTLGLLAAAARARRLFGIVPQATVRVNEHLMPGVFGGGVCLCGGGYLLHVVITSVVFARAHSA